MKSKSTLGVCLDVLGVIVLSGCGDDEKGACVWGSGIGAKCWDDYTSGQCSMMNGSLHVGKKCSDFGFGKTAISNLMISEVYFRSDNGSAAFAWVELYNGGHQAPW